MATPPSLLFEKTLQFEARPERVFAALSEAEQLISFVAQIVGDAGSDTGGHHPSRVVSQIALQATAAHQSLIVARLVDEDPVTGLAVG